LLNVDVYLQAQCINYGQKSSQLRVALSTLNGNNRVDSYACQVSQYLLVDSHFFSPFLDGIPYLLLCHNPNILRFRCKVKQFFLTKPTNRNKMQFLIRFTMDAYDYS